MRRAGSLALVLLASCEGLFGVDFDHVTARAPDDAGTVDGAEADADGGLSCAKSEHICSAKCVSNDDPTFGCGATDCSPCGVAENGAAWCDARGCAIACAPTFRRCASGCCPIVEQPVAAGTSHTCATAQSGALYCWGYNASGQLGDNSRETKLRPSLVFGLEGGVRGVAVGVDFTVAVSASGTVFAWGANAFGTLADGSKEARSTPNAIASLGTSTRYVVAGGGHACAVSNAGSTSCWGYNVSGVVGSGSTAPIVAAPELLPQLEAFTSVVSGTAHACALGVSGATYCWGANEEGLLGFAEPKIATTPTLVSALTDVVSIATGAAHACVVTKLGAVRCWGENFLGELGVGDTMERSGIVDVLPPSAGARSVVAGDTYTCATFSSGAVRCWGLMASSVGVGTGGVDPQFRPVNVDVGGPVAEISAGARHACARLLDRRILCWGANNAGQLGEGTRADQKLPIEVVLPN